MSRTDWILGGLLILLLLVVGVMGLFFWFQPDLSAPPPATTQAAVAESTAVFSGRTAMAASATAERQAKEWQADALLLKATATWQQESSNQDMSSGATTWNFTYYSPGATAIAVITILEDQATLLSEKALEGPLSPLEVTGWKVDSPEAVRTLLNEGGATFVNDEGPTTLIMTLTTANPSGRIEWFTSLFAAQSGNSFTMRLDATSAEVLEVVQAP